ncbi:MAG: hypothetical protein JO328_06770 [Hyphomicrobiales bacterium]|nr:hypothetical protein [Hyphomicrobiales bacterium]MBV8825326.1 hypothetical protein [Hyphomicrobiales bacterium]MBV9429039.1 hypothetical protein [Bradyrhizobiaceae bacterium]
MKFRAMTAALVLIYDLLRSVGDSQANDGGNQSPQHCVPFRAETNSYADNSGDDGQHEIGPSYHLRRSLPHPAPSIGNIILSP